MRKIEIDYIHIQRDIIIIGWSAENIGFGQLTLVQYEEGKFDIDSECMSKEFCNDVLAAAAKYILKDFTATK